MQKIKTFIISNSSEILSVFSIFIIFSSLIFLFWNHFGLAIVDCGREAYFPEQILEGKILYKDIFNIFGPLSYLINVAFYKLLGINLNTLRIAGAINTFLTIFLLYFITRLFTSREISWTVTVFIIIACAFCSFCNAFNYVFPYSYAMSYSFSAFLFSVLFSIFYLKTSKQFFMPLSWFFLGISIVSKHDFIPYILFLALFMIVMAYYKKLDTKYIIYSVIAFLTVPVISFSILFLQGLTLNELFNQIEIVKRFARVPANIHFHTTVGFYPQKDILMFVLKSFVKISPVFILVCTMVYFSLKYNKLPLNIMFIGILFCNLFPQIMKLPVLILSIWPLFTLIIFGYMLYRIITEKQYSYLHTYLIFLILAFCIFAKPDLFLNFYASSAVYAIIAVLFSILFLMLYLKTSRQYFMLLGWFFMGISITLEWEYIGFVVLFTLLAFFINKSRKVNTRFMFYNLISFVAVPVINCLIIFLLHLTINDFLNQIPVLQKFIRTLPIDIFHLRTSVFYSPEHLSNSAFHFLYYILTSYMNIAVLIVGLVYFSLKSININIEKFNKFILYCGFLLILYYCLPYNNALLTYPLIFSGIAMFTVLILGVILFRLIKKGNTSYDSLYLILLIAALIASSKSFFGLNLYTYGPFTLPLLFIANSIFIVEYLPIWFKFIDKKLLKQTFVIMVLGITMFAFFNLMVSFNKGYIIKTNKGNIYDGKNYAATTQQAIDYIEKNLKPQDSIWVIPEGIMINFVTNHPSNGIYYSMIPSYIQTFGEDKIIADTKKNPPDYIIINDRKTDDHGLPYICEDYGFKICKYVDTYYNPVKRIFNFSELEDSFTMIIYKRK